MYLRNQKNKNNILKEPSCAYKDSNCLVEVLRLEFPVTCVFFLVYKQIQKQITFFSYHSQDDDLTSNHLQPITQKPFTWKFSFTKTRCFATCLWEDDSK